MTTDFEREGYRDRLNKGDIVYLAEGHNPYRPDEGELVTRKATITDAEYEGHRRHYPFIVRWNEVDSDPRTLGLNTSVSPRSLFTEREVNRLVLAHEGPIAISGLSIDELVAHPIYGSELAQILGEAQIKRMADDMLRRPRDPEY